MQQAGDKAWKALHGGTTPPADDIMVKKLYDGYKIIWEDMKAGKVPEVVQTVRGWG